ncbi:DNA-processing protein DprA [Thiomicrorhabdus cannonii]|uniref:DNA-processing protein DprA n=1 Tax=Thiomicrorhabdus cannonii TaxID=2748011 RepID=UPI0015BF1BAB|nr:DNA-processing protein DprA [Thiomicrorhabdus cannonii]
MSRFYELADLLALHLNFFSLKQLQQAESYFGSLAAALQAGESVWRGTGIATDKQLQGLFADDLKARIDASLAWQGAQQHWVGWQDEDYPPLLAQIDDAPILLGVRGRVELLRDPQVAIVGSRHASKAGVNAAEDFAEFLSSQGITVTSGLALGIDAAAHRGALRGLGKTVAVVATGLDRIYPAANKALAHQIVEEGAMVSEFPLGTKPLNYNFPKRNRIISGLSVGTLVVEAALQSGSLITAKMAAEQGREVFAVPGSIHNPQAKGCHQLIKQGAKLVESGEDVLVELAPVLQGFWPKRQANEQAGSQAPAEPVKAAKEGLLAFIEYEPIGLDELVVVSKWPVSAIQSELLLLELSGAIEALSAGRYRRLR